MILKMFSIYDSKADTFIPPFYMHSNGLALRTFSDCVLDPNHQFSKHPEDYTLFELGTFDDGGGSFDVLPTPKSLALAIEFVSGE